MKLYLVKSALPYFVSWQDDAKRDARQLKCDWEQVDVPTGVGREELAAFLNTLGGPATVQIVEPDTSDISEAKEEFFERAELRMPAITTTDVTDFVLNTASVAQVEQVFAALGTRFKELANEKELLS